MHIGSSSSFLLNMGIGMQTQSSHSCGKDFTYRPSSPSPGLAPFKAPSVLPSLSTLPQKSSWSVHKLLTVLSIHPQTDPGDLGLEGNDVGSRIIIYVHKQAVWLMEKHHIDSDVGGPVFPGACLLLGSVFAK